MKKLLAFLLALPLLLAIPAIPQAPTGVPQAATTPNEPCAPGYFYNTTAATTLTCQGGHWIPLPGGAGGASGGTSLPATCTVGTQFNLNLPPPAGGVFFCTLPNIWVPDNPSKTISPLSYGAKFDLAYSYQISATASNATITFQTGDYVPQAADIGKNFFAYQSPFSTNNGIASTYATIATPTTITGIGAHTFTLASAGAVTNSCTPTGNQLCIGVWYTQDDSTAINNAATAAWSVPGYCYALQFPEGAAAIAGPILNIAASALSYPCGGYVTTAGLSGIDVAQTGPQVFGQGPWNSILVPTPGYNYAGCTFGQSTHGCNFTTPNLAAYNLGLNGMGQATATGNPTVNLVEMNGSAAGGACTGSTLENVTLANWLVNDPNATGLDLGRESCGDPLYQNIISELAGGTNCRFVSAGTIMNVQQPACFGSSVASLEVDLSSGTALAPGIVNTTGGYYTNSYGAVDVLVNANSSGNLGIWNSKGEFIACVVSGGSVSAVKMSNTNGGSGIINLDGDSVALCPSAVGGQTLWEADLSGSQFHVKNSTIISAGTGSLLQSTVAGGKFYDEGGNTWINGGSAKSSMSGTFIADGHSLKGSCTGTFPATAGTYSLYGTGPNVTATTCAGQTTTLGAGVPMEGTRTLTFLICTAAVAGGASAACTIFKNGSATAATCSLNGVTSCVDDQHQIAAADGDLISVGGVVGTSDTLAGLKAIVDWSN